MRSPLEPANAGQISKDRRSALVQFEIRGDEDKADTKVQPVLDAVARVQQQHPGFTVAEFGFASSTHELNNTLSKDFQRAEYSSLPVTLIILLSRSGRSWLRACRCSSPSPACSRRSGSRRSRATLSPPAARRKSVILLIGMAVGVDYSLFYLRREREERARGLSPRDALLKAAGTSGHAVFISGLTVLIAMAGMLFTGNAVFTSIAVGAMLMVAVALIGSLSVLPALLASSAIASTRDGSRSSFAGGPASRGSGASCSIECSRRPVVSVVLSAGVLLALAVPAFSMHTQLPSFTDLPKSLAIVRTYESIQRAFPGAQTPAKVVVAAGDVTAPRVQQAIARSRAAGARERPDVRAGLDRDQPGPDRRDGLACARGQRRQRGPPWQRSARSAIEVIPATVGASHGVQAAVTGETAGTHDFNQQMKSHAPFVFAFVLALCFLLLLVTFRSIVIPIKAVLLNLLSVGAAYGLLVLVFQHRFAEGILGFHSNGAITSWLPLFMFVILFGLSMDYHVFILSRIKELVDGGMSDRGCGRDRDQADRRNGDERSRRDGRRVRDLRDAPDARHQADGLRARRRDPDRRDSGQGRPAAGRDEAARRLELVPAPLARLATQAERRAWPGSRGAGTRAGARRAAGVGVQVMLRGYRLSMSMEQRGVARAGASRPGVSSSLTTTRASAAARASCSIAEGFDVVGEAEDGASALALAARLVPELVLLDIQLPDLDGLAVAERLLASPPGAEDRARLESGPLDLRLSDRGERSTRLHREGRASPVRHWRGCWSDGHVSPARR